MLEIVREEQADSEAIGIAAEAAIELGERLKRLRGAWGPAAEVLDLETLRRYGTSLATPRQLRLDLVGIAAGTRFEPGTGRMILNLLLLAAEALPGGGLIAMSSTADGKVLVTVSGPRAAWPAGLAACLADEAAARAAVAAGPRATCRRR